MQVAKTRDDLQDVQVIDGPGTGNGKGLTFGRHFSTEGTHPFDEVEWETRDAVIPNFKEGGNAFEQRGVAAFLEVGDDRVTGLPFDLVERVGPLRGEVPPEREPLPVPCSRPSITCTSCRSSLVFATCIALLSVLGSGSSRRSWEPGDPGGRNHTRGITRM